MGAREALVIRLFIAKQECKSFLEGSADARKSAQAADTEFPSEIYLTLAKDLDALADQKRAEITNLQSQLEQEAG